MDTALEIREYVKKIAKILLDEALLKGRLVDSHFIAFSYLDACFGPNNKEYYQVCGQYMNSLHDTYGFTVAFEEHNGEKGFNVGITPAIIDFLVNE